MTVSLNKNIVTTATVRAAFASGALDASKVVDEKGNPVSTASLFGKNGDGKVRGRIHPAFVAAYTKANPSATFAERVKTEKTVTVTPTRLNAKGQPVRFKPREIPMSEARRLAGAEGKMGRLSAESLAKVAEALGKK